MLNQIKGQEQALSVLNHAIQSDKVGQAYLFFGPEGVGKFTTALYFAMALNCQDTGEGKPCGVCNSCRKFLQFNHPDFIYIFPTPNLKITMEGDIQESKYLPEYKAYLTNKMETPWKEFFFSANTEIRMDSICHLQHRLSTSINEANYRVCIIESAECMNNKTANAFLKTLEEPPARTVLILTTVQPSLLLPTVLSRCQHLRFKTLASRVMEDVLEEKISVDKVAAKTFARISNGNLKRALRLCESGKLEARGYMINLLDMIVARDDLKFMDFINEKRSGKGPSFISEIIDLLIIVIGDLAFLHDAPEHIVNIDLIPVMEMCYQVNPQLHEELPKMLEKMEKMYFRVEQHVNPQLILTGIYNIFQQALYPND
ncbi:MAG TPA: DNA polymerase III subunit delta' [Candidatus Cloacimonadota bacterium]|nr:DNA polymerase III subunit delta' [Candidatus Cloacimonadota bacterium]